MKSRLLFLPCLFMGILVYAQPNATYYPATSLDGKSGQSLELALKKIVNPHTKVKYDNLWEQYEITDPGPLDSIPSSYTGGKTDLVYDMYAWMLQFPKFYSTTPTSAAHSQTGGFNREHCVPNSWWGGETGNAIAYTDLHHLVPGDGAANNAKSNWPLGEYKSGMTLNWPTATKPDTSPYYMTKDEHTHTEDGKCYQNSSHVWGVSNSSDYGGASFVFEPADEYKGDFARMYLYVVCAYEKELVWSTDYMFTSSADSLTTIKPWALSLLLKWHRQDRVSDKERTRNDAVFGIQGNRNPFIDYPELVEYIWGNKNTTNFALANTLCAYSDEYKNGQDTPLPATDAPVTFVLHGKVGEPFTGFKYTSDSDGKQTYKSSDSKVAKVNETTGDVTLISAGTAIITFTIEESATYSAGEKKYIIEVTN